VGPFADGDLSGGWAHSALPAYHDALGLLRPAAGGSSTGGPRHHAAAAFSAASPAAASPFRGAKSAFFAPASVFDSELGVRALDRFLTDATAVFESVFLSRRAAGAEAGTDGAPLPDLADADVKELLHPDIVADMQEAADQLKKRARTQPTQPAPSAPPSAVRVLRAAVVDTASVWDGTLFRDDLENGKALATEQGHSVAVASRLRSGNFLLNALSRVVHTHGLQPPRRVEARVTVAFLCEEACTPAAGTTGADATGPAAGGSGSSGNEVLVNSGVVPIDSRALFPVWAPAAAPVVASGDHDPLAPPVAPSDATRTEGSADGALTAEAEEMDRMFSTYSEMVRLTKVLDVDAAENEADMITGDRAVPDDSIAPLHVWLPRVSPFALGRPAGGAIESVLPPASVLPLVPAATAPLPSAAYLDSPAPAPAAGIMEGPSESTGAESASVPAPASAPSAASKRLVVHTLTFEAAGEMHEGVLNLPWKPLRFAPNLSFTLAPIRQKRGESFQGGIAAGVPGMVCAQGWRIVDIDGHFADRSLSFFETASQVRPLVDQRARRKLENMHWDAALENRFDAAHQGSLALSSASTSSPGGATRVGYKQIASQMASLHMSLGAMERALHDASMPLSEASGKLLWAVQTLIAVVNESAAALGNMDSETPWEARARLETEIEHALDKQDRAKAQPASAAAMNQESVPTASSRGTYGELMPLLDLFSTRGKGIVGGRYVMEASPGNDRIVAALERLSVYKSLGITSNLVSAIGYVRMRERMWVPMGELESPRMDVKTFYPLILPTVVALLRHVTMHLQAQLIDFAFVMQKTELKTAYVRSDAAQSVARLVHGELTATAEEQLQATAELVVEALNMGVETFSLAEEVSLMGEEFVAVNSARVSESGPGVLPLDDDGLKSLEALIAAQDKQFRRKLEDSLSGHTDVLTGAKDTLGLLRPAADGQKRELSMADKEQLKWSLDFSTPTPADVTDASAEHIAGEMAKGTMDEELAQEIAHAEAAWKSILASLQKPAVISDLNAVTFADAAAPLRALEVGRCVAGIEKATGLLRSYRRFVALVQEPRMRRVLRSSPRTPAASGTVDPLPTADSEGATSECPSTLEPFRLRVRLRHPMEDSVSEDTKTE
jgi:hypothetical protein